MTRIFMFAHRRLVLCCVTLLWVVPSAVGSTESGEEVGQSPPWIALQVYPPQLLLHGHLDAEQVIVVAAREDGVTRDVTSEAELTVVAEVSQDQQDSTEIARFEAGKIIPQKDGSGEIQVKFADLEAKAGLRVENVSHQRPVSFRHDVMPIFMRAGCNSGSCHGSSRGKDGFRLSLFGFDPAGDHYRLTREWAARRLNLAVAEDSLLLQKAIGAVPHTGGKLFEADSWYYTAIRQWLEDGAPSDVGAAPAVTKLQVFPPRAVLEGPDATQQFVAVATYADGSTRDVTNLAVFLSNNEASAVVSANGLVTSGQRGEVFVMARFDTHTVGSQVLVLPSDQTYEPLAEEPANYIDELVADKLRTLRIVPSAVCSDAHFLRRATIDITGQLPTSAEYREFIAEPAADKRARKIDELLERKEFSEI